MGGCCGKKEKPFPAATSAHGSSMPYRAVDDKQPLRSGEVEMPTPAYGATQDDSLHPTYGRTPNTAGPSLRIGPDGREALFLDEESVPGHRHDSEEAPAMGLDDSIDVEVNETMADDAPSPASSALGTGRERAASSRRVSMKVDAYGREVVTYENE